MKKAGWISAICVLAVISVLTFEDQARAQAYPTKPITVIIGAAAGGGSDVASRLINQFAEKTLKQPIVVINKPGAGGEIGWAEAARSRPDGYTIAWSNTPYIVTIPIQRKASFSLDDFTPLCDVISDPGVLAIRADNNLDTLEKLIAEAKKRPGEINYATSGIGGDDHLAMLGFERAAGIRIPHVPFDSFSPALAAMLGGHTTLLAANEGEMLPHVKSGKVRILATMTENRLPSLPDVPTFREKGVDLISYAGRGMSLPKGVPPAIAAKLEEAFLKASQDPEFLKKAKDLTLPVAFMGSKAYAEKLKKDDAFYRSLWKTSPWM
jgi:tripartite-type tricarboxylate transporter receptor subunit TctC